jgi:anti-sigma regulatory factor (Ser/Thr protein kinase)
VAASQDALRLERRGVLDAACQESFRLFAVGSSVAEARRRVRTRLREWGVADEARDDTEMVVSELFTNAVRHTTSERITCGLSFTRGIVRVEVTDQGSFLTEPQQGGAPRVDDEGGCGLLLVGALSASWGVYPGESGWGRTVWAELS